MRQLISIFLQAAGVLLLLWAILGWLLSGQDKGGAVVLSCLPGCCGRQEAFLRFYSWIRGTGLVRMPLILVDCGLDAQERSLLEQLSRGQPGVSFCTQAQLAERMKSEAEKHGGAGTAAG